MKLAVHRLRAAMNETGGIINVGRMNLYWRCKHCGQKRVLNWWRKHCELQQIKTAEQKLTEMHVTDGTNAKRNDNMAKQKPRATANGTGSSHAKGGNECNWQCKHQGQCQKHRGTEQRVAKKSHWQQHVTALTQHSNAA